MSEDLIKNLADSLREVRDTRPDVSAGLAREALRQVVTHWPGDLTGVSLKARRSDDGEDMIVTLLSDAVPVLGRLLRFSAHELACPVSPVVRERVRRVHREWTEEMT